MQNASNIALRNATKKHCQIHKGKVAKYTKKAFTKCVEKVETPKKTFYSCIKKAFAK